MQSWRRTFIALWGGQAISLLTSSVLQMSIVWYLTKATESAAVLSAATIVGFLPQAVLGTFAGVFVDRYNRKTVMIIADLSIALVGVVLFIIGMFGEIPIWMIFVVLFLRSIGAAFHQPCLQAITPAIVPADMLTKYAGYSQTFESASLVVSPALAAILYSIWDLNIIILLDVIGAAVAISILLALHIPQNTRENKKLSVRHVWQETLEGLRIIRQKQGLLTLMVIGALYAVIYFPIGTYYPLITMTYFGGSIAQSGVVEAIYSVGMLAGSFVLGLVGSKIHRMKTILFSILLYGIMVFATGLLPPSGLIVFMVFTVIMGVTSPFFYGVQTSLYQSCIDEEYLGRVFALSSSISMVAMPLGLVLSGAVAEALGVHTWFLICGAMCIALSIVSALLPSVRRSYDALR